MTVRVRDAAYHLGAASGWTLSNLAMQKMLYMADMNFVGINGIRLVDEPFEAWDYGPVLPSLYHDCKAFGSKPVPHVFWGAYLIGGTPEANIIESAWQALRSDTPGQLVSNTHRHDGAWAKRYIAGAKGIKITDSDMIDEYRNRTAAASSADEGYPSGGISQAVAG